MYQIARNILKKSKLIIMAREPTGTGFIFSF